MSPWFPHRSRSAGRRLARAWAFQGVTWYGLTEVLLRVAVEGGFVLVLAIAGVPLAGILVAWLGLHTAAWLVFYGGFHLAWKLLGVSADVARIDAHLERIRRWARKPRWFRSVLLRGGIARGSLDERSDIDLLLVPEAPIASKVAGVLSMWLLRAKSMARRVPVEARWLDTERYVPFHARGERVHVLSEPRPTTDIVRRRRVHGLLVTFSGIDGSGKTTIAKRVVARLTAQGFDVVRFWAHRQAWLKPAFGPDIGLSVLFESLWKRLGRQMEDLGRHPRVRFLYGTLTLLDYVYVRARTLRLSRPGAIVLCDRYVADVIVQLRGWGPVNPSIEGLLVGLSREPDLAILFELDPATALQRKQENRSQQLEAFSRDFDDLRDRLRLVPVDARRPVDDVLSDVTRILETRLGLTPSSLPDRPETSPAASLPPDPTKDGV